MSLAEPSLIQNPVSAAAPDSSDNAFWEEIQQGDSGEAVVVEEVDLGLDLDLSGKGLPWFQVSRELEEFLRKSDGVRPRSLNLRESFLSLDGSSALSRWLDPDPTGLSKGEIQSLNLASCSVGRTLDDATSAYRLIDGGCAALGASGNRLLNLDLGWNDLSSEAVEALVRNLLQVQSPAFHAETVDPRSLLVGRGCALETLTLTGNTIGDDGVYWLLFLLKHSARLSVLNLRQCAVEGWGGAALASHCAVGESSGIAESLKHLDLRDNDLGDASAELARVAAVALSDLNGGQVIFADLRRQLEMELSSSSSSSSSSTSSSPASPSSSSSASSSSAPPPSSGLTLAPGPDSMCHGVLAVLFALRRSTDDELSRGGGGGGGAVTLDLRGTQACGYYMERGEVLQELLSQLSVGEAAGGGGDDSNSSSSEEEEDAQDDATTSTVVMEGGGEANVVAATDATSATEATTATSVDGSNLSARRCAQEVTVIKKILLDNETGFSDRQVRILYEACDPGVTEVFLNGVAYEPAAGWAAGCALQ